MHAKSTIPVLLAMLCLLGMGMMGMATWFALKIYVG